MITIEQEKCIGCRQCQNICHTESIKVENGKAVVDYRLCSTCTQCISICPVLALSWDRIPPRLIDKSILPGQAQLKEFLKQRRSIRKFQDRLVERKLLSDIAVIGKYSPTNNYDIDVIILDDKGLIAQLENECIRFIGRMYKLFYRPKFVFNTMKKITPAINEIDKIKTERTLRRGSIFQNAPALIILTADRRISHTELSCQYFLYNMSLYAQSLGIGSCISGAGKTILSKNKRARRFLNIPSNKDITGILFLGYPSIDFKNKVEGIEPKIQWNTGK